MEVRSLGYRADLIFAGFSGEIIDRGEYLVIRIPSNPTFYWGNFLLFALAPGPGDEKLWRQLLEHEIGQYPQVGHQAFGRDSVSGEIGSAKSFVRAGFRLDRMAVLKAGQKIPKVSDPNRITIRPLADDEDWAQTLENQVICRDPGHDELSHRIFKQRQMADYRQMAAQGMGNWFGAFPRAGLVGDLGIFHSQRIGRYQAVGVHPDFRRRAIGRKLIAHSARYALDHFGLDTLVIVADLNPAAQRLYQATGFVASEMQASLELWLPPPATSPTPAAPR
jgi:GNAT superfamily N-acetyltransferase